jgi:hypothetical protein
MTPQELCIEGQNSSKLLPLAIEAFNYKFDETPDYNKLKFLLCKILLDKNIVPDVLFDWSEIPTSVADAQREVA